MRWWWVTIRFQRSTGEVSAASYAVEGLDEQEAWVEGVRKLHADRSRRVGQVDEGDVEPLEFDRRPGDPIEAAAIARGMEMAAAEGRLR